MIGREILPRAIVIFSLLFSLIVAVGMLWVSSQGVSAAVVNPATPDQPAGWQVSRSVTSTINLPIVLNGWPPPTWHSDCPDCPRYVKDTTQRALAVDSVGILHAAFGGDNLYHAWDNGSGWQYEIVDSTGGVGGYAALSLDNADHPHIAYYDAANQCLKYARFDGASWHTETADCGYGGVGWHISLALDGNNRPHIAYHDYYVDSLRYAHWEGADWLIEVVEASQNGYSTLVGNNNSIVMDSANQPHILYSLSGWGEIPYIFQHAWRDSQWHIEIIEKQECCFFNSTVIDDNDLLHVAYQTYSDPNTAVIRYGEYDGSQWLTQTVVANDDFLIGPSLALDSAGRPGFSYLRRVGQTVEVEFTRWDGSAWQTQTAQSRLAGSDLFAPPALALNGTGNPLILVHLPRTADLDLYRWNETAWQSEPLNQGGNVGKYASLKLDNDGNPQIAYLDDQLYALKYARWDGSAWQIQTLSDEEYGNFGIPSLAVETGSSYPRIAYKGPTGLEYTAWDGAAWQTVTVDPDVPDFYGGASLALDSNGYAHISYYTNDDTRYAYWDGAAWQIAIVDSVGAYEPCPTSLALDSFGLPHFSYFDLSNLMLHYAYWNGSVWITQTVDNSESIDYYNSLAMDTNDHPHIAYREYVNDDLRYAYHDGSTWITQTVDSDGNLGFFPSLALDNANRPHISYHDSTNDTLEYAWWNGSQWIIETVESGNVGWYTSLVLDVYGYPHIAHYDASLRDLRYIWFGR